MNGIITQYKKTVLLAIVLVVMSIGSALFAGCSACQAAAAIRQSIKDAHKQSIEDAQAADIAAGKSASREAELDLSPVDMKNAKRMLTSAESLEKLSLQDALEAALTAATQDAVALAALDAIDATVDAIESDIAAKLALLRAVREGLDDPCNSFQEGTADPLNSCQLNRQLQALFCCCAGLNQRVQQQGHDAQKCCKKLHHKIEDVEELVETQIGQSVACCSVVEGLIGSQIDQSIACCSVLEITIGGLGDSAFDIPDTGDILSLVDSITDADIITWLKSLYVLSYATFLCTCT